MDQERGPYVLDPLMRRLMGGPVDRLAAGVDRPGITPDRLTLAGLGLALASAVLAALTLWPWALLAWLLSRIPDALDGALARRRADAGASAGSEAGGFLDITADFTAYGVSVVGVAIGVTGVLDGDSAPPGQWVPFLAVLLAYYLNGSAFLAFSSAAERADARIDDGRTFSFIGGLAEGTETIAVHSLWLLIPAIAPEIAAVWAVVVGLSAIWRMVEGRRLLLRADSGKGSG